MFNFLKGGAALWTDWKKTRNAPPIQTNFVNHPTVRAKTNIIVTDTENLRAIFHLTDEKIINLAGGFPTDDFYAAEFEATSLPGNIIKTVLLYDFGLNTKGDRLLGRIERTIDLQEMVIHNDLMFIQKQGTGIGTNIFINQLMEAISSSFNTIEVVAAGPDLAPPSFYPYKWDGFKTWIKFGYLLIPDDHIKYTNWAASNMLNEDTLNKLYFQERNYGLWEKSGFTWEGIIDLKKNRTSVLLFKLYLLKKNINVPLSLIVPGEVLPLLFHRISLYRR